ncbi:MAG: type II secretion system protein GspC [Gammaproteobacteria bacterium]
MVGNRTLGNIMHVNSLRGMNAGTLLHHGWPALEKRLPFLASVVLGVLIAWTLAVVTWSLVPRPQPAQPIYRHNAALAAVLGASTPLADLHLFGTPAAGTAVNAPETTLNLTLRGIVASGSQRPDSSFAIIAASGVGNVYGVGAEVPGGAKIQSIFPDHVLLNLNGRMQSLRLPKNSAAAGSGAALQAAPTVPPVIYGRVLPAAENLEQLRNEIVQHPERLLDMMRAMPVMQNNKLEGYRVFPVGNSDAFSKLGLQPGDIVTAVNGMPLDNPAQSMQVLNNLKTSDQVSVTFVRNGQQETKILQFQNNGALER